MKKLIAYLLGMISVCFSTSLYCQSLYPISSDEKINNSSLIVEGKVTNQFSYWNDAHTMIYTANSVEVYKVFKGQISKNVVEIVTQGGSVGSEQIVAEELLKLRIGDLGIFFCFPNSINTRSPLTNDIMFDAYSSQQGFLKYEPLSWTANAPFTRYADIKKQLYTELVQKTGRTYENKYANFQIPDRATVNGPDQVNAPSVTSLSPSTVNAGALLDPANNVLTINGSGFGPAAGSAGVVFDDSNDGAGGNLQGEPFNSPLVISWSDTQIKIRVPQYAGTGVVIVVDQTGTQSPGVILNVLYSVQTATFVSGGTFVKEVNLMNDNGSGGYTILYSTNTAGSGVDLNASPAKATFQRALATWKEICGFNVTEGGTTASQQINPSDGLNVIMFDNANTGNPPLPAGVLAVCYSFYSMCLPLATNQAQKTEFDVVIRNSGFSLGSTSFTLGPCPPASSSFSDIDLETVILHELGHAIGLNHINDTYEGVFLPNINPGKLMNFAIVNGVKRSSPDYSAKAGADYLITPQGNTYGSCGLASGEMTPLSKTVESKDECPGSFPTTTTTPGTIVSFDLVHSTSNKFVDPQFTAINCAGTGTGVTNTAYYAFKTGPGGTLSLTVSGYATTPASQASCSVAGVELAFYAVSSCPTGQSYPAPIACRTFNANGALTNITGLAANTNYLLFADGIENTKANFSLTFSGAALPINISSFTGSALTDHNQLQWKIDFAKDVQSIFLERSENGSGFERIGNVTSSLSTKGGDYRDFRPFISNNYYRLAIVNIDGSIEYSKLILLRRNDQFLVSVFPNPAHAILNVEINSQSKGKYSVRLRNGLGQEVIRKSIQLTGSRSTIQLQLGGLGSGVYQVSIYDQKEKLIKASSVTVE